MSNISLDPTPCNEFLLADQAALASQTKNPVPPYPIFFSTGQCNGGLTGGAGSNFPLYFFPINCNTDPSKQSTEGVPPPQNNCLRVINDFNGDFNPFADVKLDPTQVNVLPGGFQQDGTTAANNIFFNTDDRLYSWYVPPQYKMIFYAGNPMTMTMADAASVGFLEVGAGELIVDACLSGIFLNKRDATSGAISTGGTFLKYYDGKPNFYPALPDCLLANCACTTPMNPWAVSSLCGTATKSKDVINSVCPGVEHRAPYFVIVKTQDFSDMIREMCVNNRQIVLGTDLNSLNKVWKPQADGCDTFVTNLCNISNVEMSPYKELCACFTQQQALDNQFGEAIDVPVCCFGFDGKNPDDITQACSFNTEAYKTGAMLKNCCSFAECAQVVEQSPEMQARASPAGQVKCEGSFVQFPIPQVTPPGPLPSVTIEDSNKIPVYVWIIFVTAVVLLVLYVIALAFV